MAGEAAVSAANTATDAATGVVESTGDAAAGAIDPEAWQNTEMEWHCETRCHNFCQAVVKSMPWRNSSPIVKIPL